MGCILVHAVSQNGDVRPYGCLYVGHHPKVRRFLWDAAAVAVGVARPGGRLLKRLIITLVVAAISFLATAWLLPRIAIDRPLDAVIAVILIALLDGNPAGDPDPGGTRVVDPELGSSCSSTSAGVVVRGLVALAPGVHVDGFETALIGSFIYAIINTILTSILGIDSGGSFRASSNCWSELPLAIRTRRAW